MKARVLLWVAAAFFASAAFGETGVFPKELSHLNALVNDEANLVEAVRQYDVLQQALIEWDKELAEGAAMAGDMAEADRRMEMVNQRRELLDQVYTILLQHYPKNARALNYYGEYLYDQRGEIAGAIRSWKLAAAEDSKLSLPHNNLGIHYTHVGEYERGIAEYTKAMELEPDNADFKYNLAQVYMINWPQVKEAYGWEDAKIYKEAMKLSKSAAELRPKDYHLRQDYAVNFFAAERFNVKADWKEAAAAWQNARDCALGMDQVFFTWLNEARVCLEIPDHERAIACLQEALKIMPSSVPAQTLLARAQAAIAEKSSSS
jgi:tetratricopeptide (TPR) repeat protein